MQVATSSLQSSLLKYSAKEYFFRAGLCHLCVDVLNAQQALERYADLYPAFQDSREYKLIKVWKHITYNLDWRLAGFKRNFICFILFPDIDRTGGA